MIKSKKQSFIVIGVFALVLMLGTITYAFFNYTRTGSANTIRTGRISFNTSQSNTLNLTNVFPMSATDAGNANLDAVSVRIWGDTIYADGEEYEISIVDVNNTIGSGNNAKTVPINYIATYTATPVQSGDPTVIGTNSDSYFTARGQSSPVYQLSATGEATNGKQVLVGFIPSGATGVDGTLTIKAYLDSSKIAISDTYPAEETDTNSDGYIDGTPASFGEGKTVLTTTEWNALQNTQTPLSFKIKAISQEGTWVEEPHITITYNANGGTISSNSKSISLTATTYGDLLIPTATTGNYFDGWYTAETGGTKVTSTTQYIDGTSPTTLYAHYLPIPTTMAEMCPNCLFTYFTDNLLYATFDSNHTPATLDDLSVYYEDYDDIISYSERHWFLGVIPNSNTNEIERAFACGLKDGTTPFCLEGSNDDSKFEKNLAIMKSLWGDTITEEYDNYLNTYVAVGYLPNDGDWYNMSVYITKNGLARYGGDGYNCNVYPSEGFRCIEY